MEHKLLPQDRTQADACKWLCRLYHAALLHWDIWITFFGYYSWCLYI